jgi:flagellin-like hook-associated protein FlgL
MSCSISTILSNACTNKFLQLAETDPKLAKAVMLQLLCNITSAAGTGGVGGINNFAGDGAPTTQVPANGAGTYWDRLNKIQYQWNQTIYLATSNIPLSWEQ